MNWISLIIKGALIGTGAILPGISGGVLCVVLGVYKPLMAFLAHPIQGFKQYIRILIPLLLGFAAGVVLLSRVVEWLFRTSEAPATWLFIGLVVGTLPALYHEAGQEGRPGGSWAALALGAAFMAGIMLLLRGQGVAITPTFPWWLLCGALWGIGLVVPGLSPSSFFIFLGLYEPMTAGIGSLDFSVLIPLGIGMAVTIALTARGMNALLKCHYTYTMHAILGIVIASTIGILPLSSITGAGDVALYALCFISGCAVAYAMDRLSAKLKPEGEGV